MDERTSGSGGPTKRNYAEVAKRSAKAGIADQLNRGYEKGKAAAGEEEARSDPPPDGK